MFLHLPFPNNIIIIETKVLLPQNDVTLDDFDYPVYHFGLLAPKYYYMYLFFFLLAMNVPGEGYYKHVICALN